MKKNTLTTIIGGVIIVAVVVTGGMIVNNQMNKKTTIPPIIKIPGVTTTVDNSTNNNSYKNAIAEQKINHIDSTSYNSQIYIEITDPNGKILIPKKLVFNGTLSKLNKAPKYTIPTGYSIHNISIYNNETNQGIVSDGSSNQNSITLKNIQVPNVKSILVKVAVTPRAN